MSVTKGIHMRSLKKLLVSLCVGFSLSINGAQFDPLLVGALAIQAAAATILEFDLVPQGNIKVINIKIPYKTLVGGTLSAVATGVVLCKQPNPCLKEMGVAALLTTATHLIHSPWTAQFNLRSIVTNTATIAAPFIAYEACTKHVVLNGIWRYLIKPVVTLPLENS